MAKIAGVGGVFFKSTGDRAALAAWYRKHLGKRLAVALAARARTGLRTRGEVSMAAAAEAQRPRHSRKGVQ